MNSCSWIHIISDCDILVRVWFLWTCNHSAVVFSKMFSSNPPWLVRNFKCDICLMDSNDDKNPLVVMMEFDDFGRWIYQRFVSDSDLFEWISFRKPRPHLGTGIVLTNVSPYVFGASHPTKDLWPSLGEIFATTPENNPETTVTKNDPKATKVPRI